MFDLPQVIVILTIDNVQKTVFLRQKFMLSEIYDIFMDENYQGQVQKVGKGWTVNLIPNSPIPIENKFDLAEAMFNAVEEILKPKS